MPFIDQGRDGKGVDCWGLVCLVMKRECGITLPAYGDISARDLIEVTATIREQSNAEPWHPVTKPKPFDVALMRGKPMHVGIMADDSHVLHIEEATAAVLVPTSHPAIAFRLLGFRRHKELLNAS